MRTGLLSELSVIGYEIFLEGENIRLLYQKPGNPPETVKPLIDELRKHKTEAVNILKARSIISRKAITPNALLTTIWANPYAQATMEARRESLLECMTATWETIANPTYKKGFEMTPEIKAVEMTIGRIQAQVLEGKAKLEDFRKVCINWEKAVRQDANGT